MTSTSDVPSAGGDSFAEDPPIARQVRRVDFWVGKAEQVVLFSLLMFLVLVTFLWFITEHFASAPLENASYDVRYACFLIAMIGGAFAAHHRRLLSMDFVSHFMAPRVRAWVRLVNTIFASVIAGVFLKYGLYIYEETSKERGGDHWIPAGWGNAAMAIGAGLLLFHLVCQVIIDVDYLARGKQPPEPQMGAI